MKNIPLLLITLGGSIVVILVIALGFSRMANTPIDPVVLLGEQKYATGSAQAKVTIVEFSDFQCPACRSAAPLVDKIVATYPEDVRHVYRFFPLLSIHRNAQPAAEAAIAAGSLGKFWEYHTILFDKQLEWEGLNNPTDQFVQYAQQIGLEKDTFLQALTNTKDEAKRQISKDLQDGNRVGISATPTFFVNGKKTPVQELFSSVESGVKKE